MGGRHLELDNLDWHARTHTHTHGWLHKHSITDYTHSELTHSELRVDFGSLSLSPHTQTVGPSPDFFSSCLLFCSSHLPSAWEEAASLRSDWLLCRWLTAGWGWVCVRGVRRGSDGVGQKWVVGWLECQEWRNQGAKIRAGDSDFTLF